MATFRWPGSWDPFASLRTMQRELERLVGRGPFGESQRIGGGVYPPVNVLNSPEDMIVQCEVTGVQRGDLDISITGDTLVIKGTKKSVVDEEKVNFLRRERGIGNFSRTIILPDKVDSDRIEAKLDAGILTVTLAKSEAAKPKQVPVK
ncbi:MAG: Hsp20/alpha crystallin family protein [Planctomycetota bacterium]|nr:Hsp20/alpha crystallin family protein [Planctomycetota bacterium]